MDHTYDSYTSLRTAEEFDFNGSISTRRDSSESRPDSVETEAESISPRSLDSLAAAVGNDVVQNLLQNGRAQLDTEDQNQTSQLRAENSLQAAYSSFQAIDILSVHVRAFAEARNKNTVQILEQSQTTTEPWIVAMERRVQRERKGPAGRIRKPAAGKIDFVTLNTNSLLNPEVPEPEDAVSTRNRQSQQGQDGERKSTVEAQAAFDATISEFELEAFLEQQEELRDGLRRKTKQTRLAFGARWVPGRPFSWAYILSPEYLASRVELDSGVALEQRSLLLFDLTSTFRRVCLQVSRSKGWSAFTMGFISANSICLFVEDPFYTPPDQRAALDGVYAACTAVFMLETVINCVAYGVILGPGTYLRRRWSNSVDLIIVVLGVIDLLDIGGSANLTAVRGIRTLRPLRALSQAWSRPLRARVLLRGKGGDFGCLGAVSGMRNTPEGCAGERKRSESGFVAPK